MNNYSSNKKAIADVQLLGYDNDFRLIRDFLSFLHEYENVATNENPKTIRLTGHPSQGESRVFESGHFHGLDNLPVIEDRSYTPKSSIKGKTSFLVFKNQKYSTVQTKDIAFFYVRNDSVSIMCFNKQEYALNKSLDFITGTVSSEQFFRINRKYLVNFHAIKEVEHYFLRKLFVRLHIDSPEQLLINKEKTQSFLTWMEER